MATTAAPPRLTARRTTIAWKILVAVTGLIFTGYVLAHMYGNLKLLQGQESFNGYAEHLRTLGEPILPREGALWIIRMALIASLLGHVAATVALWRRAGAARRTRYAARVKGAWRSQTMRWGGLFLLLFLVWHVLHFTIAKISVNPDKQGASITQNPYQLVVASFQVWWMTLIYVAALVALAFHLAHGVFSAQQTLGWTNTPRAYMRAKASSHVVATLVVAGFLLPPLLIQFGLIK